MENIKYIVDVRLVESPSRGLQKNRNGTILYPFRKAEISVREVHICPFCGRLARAFNCSCKDFGIALIKLQDSYGDNEHKSQLHLLDANSAVVLSKAISSFRFRALEKSEILDLGADFWNPIKKQEDSLFSRCYKVSSVIHDRNGRFFLCKDVISGFVYRFEMPAIEYKARQVYLGFHEQETTNLEGSNDGYSQHCSKKLVEFKNWKELCSILKFFRKQASD